MVALLPKSRDDDDCGCGADDLLLLLMASLLSYLYWMYHCSYTWCLTGNLDPRLPFAKPTITIIITTTTTKKTATAKVKVKVLLTHRKTSAATRQRRRNVPLVAVATVIDEDF